MGKLFFVLALALVISSQYYFQAKEAGLLKLPTFEIGAILENTFVKKILYRISPELQKLENKNLTVDQLILENFEESQMVDIETQPQETVQSSQFISSVNLQEIEEVKKQKILESGREQLGKMADRKLTGSEKVFTVLTEGINQKIQSFISPDHSKGKFSAVPIGMAIVLFLTILSLGAFLVRILIHFTGFIFWVFKVLGVVNIKKIPVEMEVIE